MDDFSLDDLARKSDELYQKQKAWIIQHQRELYHYAKSKGFSAREAQVLSKKSKATIDRLVYDRRIKQSQD